MKTQRLACAALLAAAPAMAASPSPGSSLVTDGFHGALQTTVPLEVPAFHGVEPRLALAYSSSGGAGFAGVGWSLAGLGAIERVSPGQGAPRYDASDRFVLDGQELVACTSGMVSPSCATGGTHATKIENYQRIAYAAATNTWTVTRRDGTRQVYGATYGVSRGTFRWALASVEDPRGNRASYAWACDAGDCYPAAINYGPYRVTLYRELRPDPRSFANGESIGVTRYRLRSVLVTAGGAPLRAYRLTYATAAATRRSQLVAVQQLGRDVAIDASGTVTAGTALPAQTFAYQPDPASGTFVLVPPPTPTTGVEDVAWFKKRCAKSTASALWKSQPDCPGSAWNAGGSSTRAIVSGDGYAEFSDGSLAWYHGEWIAGLSSNDRLASGDDIDFGLRTVEDPETYEHHLQVVERGNLIADVGTWSASDVLRVSIEGGKVVYRRNGAQLLEARSVTLTYPLRATAALRDPVSGIKSVRISGALADLAGWCVAADGQRSQGDYNGDGRTDLLCKQGNTIQVRLGTGSGFAAPTTWLVDPLWDQGQGDFDGDGKTDLYGMELSSGTFRVALSTGTGFAAPVDWTSNDVCRLDPAQFRLLTGDFNGDGRTDVACQRSAGNANDGVWVGLSTGSRFVHAHWDSGCGIEQLPMPVDLDGDGRDDLACIDAQGGVSVELSTGARFDGAGLTGAYLLPGQCDWDRWEPGDYNGDGKTDFACASTGRVFQSVGRAFAAQTATGGFCPGERDQLLAGDVDGDGIADWICNHEDAPAADIEVRLGTGNGFAPSATWLSGWCLGGVVATDLDGDRKTDLYCDETTQPLARAGTAGAIPDVMTTWTNGIGATSTIAYAPSSTFPNVNNPPVVPVVVATTTSDGRGSSATATFSYRGGLMDRQERRFLGFAFQREIQPCEVAPCPVHDLYFAQDYGSASQVKRDEQRDGRRRLLEVTENDYATNGATVPYTSLLAATRRHSFAGDGLDDEVFAPCKAGGQCRTTYVTHEYDAFGNERRTVEQGDVTVSGDERRVERAFYPNTTAFIVDRPGWETWMTGASGGTLLQQTIFLYDGSSIWDQPPQRGERTAMLRWHDATNSFVQASMTYDAYGNPVTSTDETGLVATIEYDAGHLFPVRVVSAAGDVVTAVWDPVCGGPSQVTDPAGQVTSTQRDPLCRTTRVDQPLGMSTVTAYVGLGDPATQHVRTRTPLPGAPAGSVGDPEGPLARVQIVDRYVDGLGRTYRTSSRGRTATETIETGTAFDASGAVVTQAAEHYSGEPAQVTRFEHDALGRTTATVLPDQTRLTTQFGVGSVTVLDAHGHATTTRFDAYGQTVAEERAHDGSLVIARREYDALGRLVAVVDPAGNRATWAFDSLGRTTRSDDPDAGTRTFTYDAAGRTLDEVDPRGHHAMTYAAGRLASRTTADGTTTFAYGEFRPGYANAGRLTTMIDPASSLQIDYDALGRAVRRTRRLDGVDYTATKQLAPGGELVALTYPDGETIGPATYDRTGRLAAIAGILTEVLYDAAGHAVKQTNANGTATTSTYAPARQQLVRIATTGPAPVQDVAYAYDAAGMVTSASSPFPGESWTYTYDDLHRLTVAVPAALGFTNPDAERFTYDIAGNMTSSSKVGAYSYPAPGAPRPHAPTAVAGQPMTYDAAGGLLQGNGRSLSWTADGLPAQIGGTTFTYDGAGARLAKYTAGSATRTPSEDYELTDGAATKYIRGPGGVVAKRTGGATFWLHHDRLGSIQAITDASGAVVKRTAHRPFGARASESGSHDEPHGYIGERRDAETDLMYLHARYYDPAIGLFLSPDPSHPASAGVGSNRYAYAMQDPIDNRDPSGLRIIEPVDEGYCYWRLVTITTIQTVPPFATTTSYRITQECTRGAYFDDVNGGDTIPGPRAPFMPSPCDMNENGFRCLGPDAPKKPHVPPAIPPTKKPDDPPQQPPPDCPGQPDCHGQPPTPPSKPQPPAEKSQRTYVPLGLRHSPTEAIDWHQVKSNGNEWRFAGKLTGAGTGAALGFIFSPPGGELAEAWAGARIGASLGGLIGWTGGALHSIGEQSPGVLHLLQASAYGGVW